ICHAGEDYHPDHRAASALGEAASWFAASRGHVTDSPALGEPPRLWFADTLDMAGFAPQFFVDVSEQLEVKARMLGLSRHAGGARSRRRLRPAGRPDAAAG